MRRLTSRLGAATRLLFAVLGLSLLTLAPAARGDLYQGFGAHYPPDNFVAAGSLADPSGTLATSGNHLRSPNYSDYTAGPLDTWGTPGTDLWVSWLQRRDLNKPGFQGLVVEDPQPDGQTRYGVYFIGDPGTGPGDNTYVIGRAGDDLNVVSSGVPVGPNQTAFLVAHFQFRDGNDLATLFVNPTPGTVEPTGGVTYSGLDMPIDQPFVELLGTSYNSNGAVQEFDELRIGGTYAAVAPVAPEPAGLVVIGAMVMLLRRTRRVI